MPRAGEQEDEHEVKHRLGLRPARAAWTFVLWGVYHDSLLVGERPTGVRTRADDRAVLVRRTATFVLVMFGWALFRADSLGQATGFWRAMVVPSGASLDPALLDALNTETMLALAIGASSVLLPRGFVLGRVVQGRSLLPRIAVLALLPWAAITVAAGSFSPFLYFRF